MKIVLIYATEPELKPIAFVKDIGDVAGYINQRKELAEEKARGDAERAGAKGGTVAIAAMQKWRSARWVELELTP